MAAAEPQTGPQPEPQAPQAVPAAPPPTVPETVSREEHQRELDRYRNQLGQEKKKAEELAARLAEKEEAGKSEQEKLLAAAAKAEQLEPRLKAVLKILNAQIEAKAALLPEAMRDLIPEGEPEIKLAFIEKALAALSQIAPQIPQQSLPAPGGRNSTPGGPGVDDSKQNADAEALYPTLSRMVPARRGP